MDFLVCKKACGAIRPTSQKDIVLIDLKDTTEAIAMARCIASETRKGFMVALFSQDQ